MEGSAAARGAAVDPWDWDVVCARCLRHARRLTSTDAEDVAQEAALRAWRRRSSCRTPHSPDGWLLQIVRNEASRAAARRRDVVFLEDSVPPPDRASWTTDDTDVRVTVSAALSRLDAEDRRLLTMRYEDDLTQPAIARVLDLPEGTVKVRLHRLRHRLRSELGDA